MKKTRETKTVVLLLALAVVATMAVPTLGANPKININKTTGGGLINSTVMPNQSTFGFVAINSTSNVKGQLQYVDHGAQLRLHGNVTMLSVNKTTMTATFSGWARATNATGAKSIVQYTVNVTTGKHGVGTFNITVPAIGYTNNGTLLGGNIKVDP